MIILGIETASSLCGVGLVKDDEFVADYRFLKGNIHAERLPVAVEKLMSDANIALSEIDGIAVSIGPGSFTGLRIGLGFSKGLAFGLDKPLIPVPTMEGLVYQLPNICHWACVMLIARKGEIYQRIYRWNCDHWELTEDYSIIQEDNIGHNLPEGEIVFIGEGALRYKELLKRRKESIVLTERWTHASGCAVAEKGLCLLKEEKIIPADNVVPLYLKRFKDVEL
jgi:tRNA threonylcarbamoyladenosine biosynthesis protein TsaB